MTEEKKKKKKKRKKEKLVSISPHIEQVNDVNIIPRHLVPVLPLSYAPAPTMTDGPQLPPSR